MTIHGTPPLELKMSEINAEFGRGTSLGAYRGTHWYTDAGGSSDFAAAPASINMSNFYSKRLTPPSYTGSRIFYGSEVWTVPNYLTLDIRYWGGGGGGGAGYGSAGYTGGDSYLGGYNSNPAISGNAGGGQGGSTWGGYRVVAKSGYGGVASNGNAENINGYTGGDVEARAQYYHSPDLSYTILNGGGSPYGGGGGLHSNNINGYWTPGGNGGYPGGAGGGAQSDYIGGSSGWWAKGGSGGGGAYVRNYWSSPNASGAPGQNQQYSFVVGGGGSGGIGQYGGNGGNGADGRILMYWTGLGEVVSTGGTITYDGAWRYHTFTGLGNFTVSQPIIAELLIVGGGGAGGVGWDSYWGNFFSYPIYNRICGGGGGAGAVWYDIVSLWPGVTYTANPGGGGGTSASTAGASGDGQASYFGIYNQGANNWNITVPGGGGGGGQAYAYTDYYLAGHPRYGETTIGSGGGGGAQAGSGPGGYVGWGNRGGDGYFYDDGDNPPSGPNAGGGGGQSGAGASGGYGGYGGSGFGIWGNIYAGGGGGGNPAFGDYNGGPYAGHGAIEGVRSATSASANMGGGGGGGAGQYYGPGGGGSGVIIIKYRYRN